MPLTPWTVDAEFVDADCIRLEAQLSLDPGPMRAFRPFLTIDLDEAHATMLLGDLALALRQLRERRDRKQALRTPGLRLATSTADA